MTTQTETNSSDLQQQLAGLVWDMYKDVHGIRPRWMHVDKMSIAELNSVIDQLQMDDMQNDQWEREQMEMDRDAIDAVCKDQGITVETYNRWMEAV